MCRAPADIALKPRFFNKGLIVFFVIFMITVRHKITQMPGVFVALAIRIVFGIR